MNKQEILEKLGYKITAAPDEGIIYNDQIFVSDDNKTIEQLVYEVEELCQQIDEELAKEEKQNEY